MTELVWIVAIFVVLNIGLILLTNLNVLTKFKTQVTSLVVAVIGAIQGVGIDFINDPKIFGWTMVGLGVTMSVLRVLTNKSYGK